MGLNAFFAYTVVLGMGYSYNQALVIVFISGIFFIVITAVGLREAIIRSIPDAVKDGDYAGYRIIHYDYRSEKCWSGRREFRNTCKHGRLRTVEK